ncbi:hypothetical protein AcV7_000568 [Taiwanofungus camphoratus]|nr:hypothetical protein AcV7_000568 [Antrodia cinnamomea]
MQPRADVEKKNALPIVSSLATPSTQGDGEASSIERSVFMNVLTALYTPASDEPGTAPPPPRQTVHSRKRKRRVSSYDMIQWTPEPQPDEADSSEDEQYRGGTMTDAGFGPKLLRQPLYKPHGMWAWADGLPVTNSQILLHLGDGANCVASLKKGLIGGRPVTYISRCWSIDNRLHWRGFHSELGLYKSKRYLRPLQGDIAPFLIGVHIDGISISLAMQPPHHSFWIEASPDMPQVLKERVLEAFRKLHSRGILHGDPELRHMLIGGDGRVTLIDFQESRARDPIPEMMLQKADSADFAMEIRRVMFKLDYGGARDYEWAKMRRAMDLEERNRVQRKGHYSETQHPEEDDILNPPVPLNEFKARWIQAADEPRRFVVPGQTPEQVNAAVQNFLSVISRMEAEHNAHVNNASRVLNSTERSLNGVLTPESPLHIAEQPVSRYNLRKRKASMTPEHPPVKRPHRDLKPAPTSSSLTSVDAAKGRPLAYNPFPKTTKSVSEVTSTEEDLPLASSSSLKLPNIKVRDFAFEQYDGPRGYYVPHPPTENRAGIERAKYIRTMNLTDACEMGLPYYMGDMGSCEFPSYKRRVPRGRHIALGPLKRKREEQRDPSLKESRAWKRARYLAGTTVLHDRPEPECLMSVEHLDIRGGLKILTATELETRPVPKSSVPSGTRRGILRQTPDIKTVSYELIDWPDESDHQFSPKLGPEPLPVPETEPRVILASFFDSVPRIRVYDDEGPNDGGAWCAVDGLSPPPPSSERDRGRKLAYTALRLTPPGFQQPRTRNTLPRSSNSSLLSLRPPTVSRPSVSLPQTVQGALHQPVLGSGASFQIQGLRVRKEPKRYRRTIRSRKPVSPDSDIGDERAVEALLRCHEEGEKAVEGPLRCHEEERTCVATPSGARSILRTIFGWWK